MSPTALQILEITEDSFRLNVQNFFSVLEKVGAHPFVLYSINGATRTGKSYALNFFIKYLESKSCPNAKEVDWLNSNVKHKFIYRGGRERTTVGINVWSEPYFVEEGGRRIAIILMDTQGLFDEKTTARQNAIVFSLSALCSSVSIFNLMKNIDENVLQQLQFFSGYANLVSSDNANDGDDDYDSYRRPSEAFQNLVFLVRDFDFPDYEFGYHDREGTRPRSDKNFFRDTFIRSPDQCARENIFVREKLCESYKQVSVFLMSHPGLKFARDNTMATEEEFRDHMKAFVELMLDSRHLVTKKIGGKEVTGLEFQKYVEAWSKLCDKADKHFPKVQTILETTAIVQNTLACGTARSFYEKELMTFMEQNANGVEDSDFQLMHQNLKEKTIKIFDDIPKLGSEETHTQYRSLVVEAVEKLFESHRKMNILLKDRKAIEEEFESQKNKVKGLEEEMMQMANESEETRKKFQTQLDQARLDLTQAAKENALVQNQLKLQLKDMEARAEATSREYEETKRKLLQQTQEANDKLTNMERKLEHAQDRLSDARREVSIPTPVRRDDHDGGGLFTSIGRQLDRGCVIC